MMTYIARHVEAQLRQTVLKALTGYAMNLIQRELGVFSAERNAASLDLENNLVEISLGRRKLAVDWPGTRNVRNVASVFLLQVIRMKNHYSQDWTSYASSIYEDHFSITTGGACQQFTF